MPDKITECPTCGPTTKAHAELVSVLGVSDKALERVLDGRRPGAKFARRWRRHVGDDLVAAWREFEGWRKEDRRRAK